MARIKFVHIPKTGGTTIHALLENRFHINEIYPYRRVGGAIENGETARDSAQGMPFFEHELISGHFPYWFIEEKDRDHESSFTFTVIRDPVDRVLSHYRYRKKENPHLEVSVQDVHPNWHCHMLASEPGLAGDELLKSAIENLEKLDYVIDYNSFEEDTKELLELLGIEIKGLKIPKFNVTEKKAYDKEMVAWIKETNREDILLYEYVKKHLLKKRESYAQKYCSFHRLKKENKRIVYTFDMPLNGRNWCFRENLDVDLPKYRWLDGKEGSIFFHLIPGSDYVLSFDAYLLTEDIKPLIKISGCYLIPKKKSEGHFSRYEVLIPKGLVRDAATEVFFCGNRSYIYNQKYPGTTDNRNLSLAINRIELQR